MNSETVRDPDLTGAAREKIMDAAARPLTGFAGDAPPPVTAKVVAVPLHLVVENPNGQARRVVEKLPFEDLKAAIRKQGFKSTVGLRRVGERFEIIFGHRRVAALREVGGDAVPAFIWDELSEVERLVIQREENALRESLTAIEEAEETRRIHVAGGGSKEETAKRMNISPQALGERLRIAELPPEILKVLHEKKVGRKHAALLANLYVAIKGSFPRPEKAATRVIAITKTCVEDGWSTRRLADQCDKEKEKTGVHPKVKKPTNPDGVAAGESGPSTSGAGVPGTAAAGSQPAPSAGPAEPGTLPQWTAWCDALIKDADEGRMSAEEKAAASRKMRDVSDALRRSPLRDGPQ